MNSELENKLQSLDWANGPYIWSLRLNREEFKQLEEYLRTRLPAADLYHRAMARSTVAYIAEWYKRCYCNVRDICVNTEGYRNVTGHIDPERLMEAAGIDLGKFFYDNAMPIFSIFVLGGFALLHESRTPRQGFFKKLYSILFDEEPDISGFTAEGRSEATVQSIRKGSLHCYLEKILSGVSSELPFAEEDIELKDSLANRFLAAIRNGYKESLKEKLVPEWRIRDMGNRNFRRGLRIRLLPESRVLGVTEDRDPSYLMVARLVSWGLIASEAEAANIQRIEIAPQFLYKGNPLSCVDFSYSLCFLNSNGLEHTFIAGHGVEKMYERWRDIPQEPVDEIKLWARADGGEPLEIQSQKCPEVLPGKKQAADVLQVWLDGAGSRVWNEWSSSRHYSGNSSAVVGPEKGYTIPASSIVQFTDFIHPAVRYRFCEFRDKLTVTDDTGEQFDYYCTWGTSYKVITDLGLQQGIFESHTAYVSSLDKEVPFIFSRDNLKLLRGRKRDDSSEEIIYTTEDFSRIEYKSQGQNIEWNEGKPAPYGILMLKLYTETRSTPFDFTCVYLPELKPETAVQRDCETHEISWRAVNKPEEIQREIFSEMPVKGGEVPSSCVELEFFMQERAQDYDESITVRVYRPIVANVIVEKNSNMVLQWSDRKAVELPYIAKDETKAVFWRKNGFECYDCSETGNIYGGHEAQRDWAREQWNQHNILARPAEGLEICFGQNEAEKPAEDGEILLWDYINEPRAAKWEEKPQGRSIIFTSRKRGEMCLSCHYPKTGVVTPFNRGKLPSLPQDICLRCFEMANEHRLYFFTFLPLFDGINKNRDKVKDLIIKPLRGKRKDGILTEQDCMGVKRLCEEFSIEINFQE